MFLAGIGTRTFRSADGTVTIVPPNVEFEPTKDMQPVLGVRDILIHFPIDGAITAEIDLMTVPITPIVAIPRWLLQIEGPHKEIKSVEFTDGTKWPE